MRNCLFIYLLLHITTKIELTAFYKTIQARELFCRTQKLSEVVELADPDRVREEVSAIKEGLSSLCGVGGGAPYGEYAECMHLLDTLLKSASNKNDVALQ